MKAERAVAPSVVHLRFGMETMFWIANRFGWDVGEEAKRFRRREWGPEEVVERPSQAPNGSGLA
ncbi:MAG: hypothetical protein L0Z50_13385, partial [Verrucomicrobiales bacterium]|nr:hypothetical protein [Verrucomicrobiales bacterium]